VDTILERAWKNQEKPFHENTLALKDLIPISVLRPILHSVINYYESLYPHCKLYSLDDWHQHDGYVNLRH
jgi:hypothetical protein